MGCGTSNDGEHVSEPRNSTKSTQRKRREVPRENGSLSRARRMSREPAQDFRESTSKPTPKPKPKPNPDPKSRPQSPPQPEQAIPKPKPKPKSKQNQRRSNSPMAIAPPPMTKVDLVERREATAAAAEARRKALRTRGLTKEGEIDLQLLEKKQQAVDEYSKSRRSNEYYALQYKK